MKDKQILFLCIFVAGNIPTFLGFKTSAISMAANYSIRTGDPAGWILITIALATATIVSNYIINDARKSTK